MSTLINTEHYACVTMLFAKGITKGDFLIKQTNNENQRMIINNKTKGKHYHRLLQFSCS